MATIGSGVQIFFMSLITICEYGVIVLFRYRSMSLEIGSMFPYIKGKGPGITSGESDMSALYLEELISGFDLQYV